MTKRKGSAPQGREHVDPLEDINNEVYDRLHNVICHNIHEYDFAPSRNSREMQVAYLFVIEALSQPNIAKRLYVSVSSIERYWNRLNMRLNLEQRYANRYNYRFNLVAAYWIEVGRELERA